jgi:hypothetical protein
MLKYSAEIQPMAKKFDGIVEAVRYKDGQIVVVRAFERRGAAFSDHVLIERHELIDKLRKGKKFVTGKRKELLASTFEPGKPLQIVSRDGKEIVATRENADHDELEQVPVF